MKCPHCATENPDNAKFCINCGKKSIIKSFQQSVRKKRWEIYLRSFLTLINFTYVAIVIYLFFSFKLPDRELKTFLYDDGVKHHAKYRDPYHLLLCGRGYSDNAQFKAIDYAAILS